MDACKQTGNVVSDLVYKVELLVFLLVDGDVSIQLALF